MATSRERMPRGVDPSTPNVARMLDFYLGGKDNFIVDRELAAQVLDQAPELVIMAREHRNFLGRVVRHLAESGIRQFVDIGSGLPTRRNVHEIAQGVAPEATVVYIDNDPIVLAHARALLAENDRTGVVEGDMTDPDSIVDDPEIRQMIDFDRPVAFLLFSMLHLIPDDDLCARIPARLRDRMAPGSHLAISHAVSDLRPEQTREVARMYRDSGAVEKGDRNQLRTKAEVERLFAGFTVVEPGVVYIPEWRPDPDEPSPDAPIWVVGGVGRRD